MIYIPNVDLQEPITVFGNATFHVTDYFFYYVLLYVVNDKLQ